MYTTATTEFPGWGSAIATDDGNTDFVLVGECALKKGDSVPSVRLFEHIVFFIENCSFVPWVTTSISFDMPSASTLAHRRGTMAGL